MRSLIFIATALGVLAGACIIENNRPADSAPPATPTPATATATGATPAATSTGPAPLPLLKPGGGTAAPPATGAPPPATGAPPTTTAPPGVPPGLPAGIDAGALPFDAAAIPQPPPGG